MAIVKLQTPLTEADVRNLKLEDMVYISGYIFTARTAFHALVIDKNHIPPMDFSQYNVIAHCGPVMKQNPDGTWTAVHAGGTTSNRFEKYGGPIIQKLGLRAMIGKGTMGEGTMKVMQEFGAVHLTTNADRIGFTPYIQEVAGVYNLDELGHTEATWLFKVKDCGPLVVDIDAAGNNLFLDIHEKVKKQFQGIS